MAMAKWRRKPPRSTADACTAMRKSAGYWTRQAETIDPPLVEPQAFSEDDQGRIVVDVQQVVRDLNGDVIADQHAQHVSAASWGA